MRDGPRRCVNTAEGLTHSSDLTREGLAMQATQFVAETWLPVVGYESSYEVSHLGRVRSVDRFVLAGPAGTRLAKGRNLSPAPGSHGYLMVALCAGGVQRSHCVHRLVAAAFIGPCPAGLQVCHNDGVKINCKVINLRYDTPSANMYDRVRHGQDRLASRTHCNYGHEFTPENTTPRKDGGRVCKTCQRERSAVRKARQREALKESLRQEAQE